MSTVAEEMLEDGAASAAKWANTLEADDLKGGAMDRIAGSYAREDLESAIAWVGDHASEDYAARAVTEVAEQWAEDDPQAVIDWASDLPESTQQRVFEEALDGRWEQDIVFKVLTRLDGEGDKVSPVCNLGMYAVKRQ